jgi:hypothetical protein
VPTLEVNPQIVKNALISSAGAVASGGTTIFTAPTNADAYVTSVSISIIKDVTCDMATGKFILSASLADTGASRDILAIAIISLTAQQQTASCSFPHPIKLLRGSTMVMSGTYAAGVCSRAGSVTYFLDETGNA